MIITCRCSLKDGEKPIPLNGECFSFSGRTLSTYLRALFQLLMVSSEKVSLPFSLFSCLNTLSSLSASVVVVVFFIVLHLSIICLNLCEVNVAVACVVSRRTLIELQVEHLKRLDDVFSYLRLLPLESLPLSVVYKDMDVQR